MVTIGNDTLPGTILTIESSTSTGVNVGAPGDGVIVGQADLDNGTASANTAEEIRTPKQAKDSFGESSLLAQAVEDALAEGAYPVYAIAPAETDVTGEDLSGLASNTDTLDNAPVVEDPDEITFTIDGTTHTTVLYRDGDPHNVSTGDIAAEEVYLNPTTGKYQIDDGTSVGSAGDDVDYTHYDYTSAHEEVKDASFNDDNLQDIVDFVVTLSENDDVVDDLQTTVGEMEDNGALAIGIAGAGDPYITDTSTYTQPYDDSRMQLYYPSRNDDGETLLGSLLGLRSALGIDRSPMSKNLETQSNLQFSLSQTQRENLVGERVNPILDRSGGAKVEDDLTTVDTTSNTEEAAFDQGFSRLVTDTIAEFVDTADDPYIGELHTASARNGLRGTVSAELKRLLASNAITAFSLTVTEVDSETASVDVGIKTTDPLRNVEASVVAGAVAGGTGSE